MRSTLDIKTGDKTNPMLNYSITSGDLYNPVRYDRKNLSPIIKEKMKEDEEEIIKKKQKTKEI